MTILSTVHPDLSVTLELQADRYWLGLPQYAVDALRPDLSYAELQPVLEQLGLVIVEWDILQMTDWCMHRGLQANLRLSALALRSRYHRLVRLLVRWHLIERPSNGERFTWRRHFRPLGPLQHLWRSRRSASTLDQYVLTPPGPPPVPGFRPDAWYDYYRYGRSRYGLPIWTDDGHAT